MFLLILFFENEDIDFKTNVLLCTSALYLEWEAFDIILESTLINLKKNNLLSDLNVIMLGMIEDLLNHFTNVDESLKAKFFEILSTLFRQSDLDKDNELLPVYLNQVRLQLLERILYF